MHLSHCVIVCSSRYGKGANPFHWGRMGASPGKMFILGFLKSTFQCIAFKWPGKEVGYHLYLLILVSTEQKTNSVGNQNIVKYNRFVPLKKFFSVSRWCLDVNLMTILTRHWRFNTWYCSFFWINLIWSFFLFFKPNNLILYCASTVIILKIIKWKELIF